MNARLRLTRQQILAFRRRVGGLDERMPRARSRCGGRRGPACRTACREPRCSRCMRGSRGVEPSTWEDPSLAQLWGPRYSTYVVPKRDFALFSLGRLPDNAKGRLRAERMAERLHAHLDGARMTDREAGRALGVGPTRSGTPRRRARSRSAGTARGRRPSGRSSPPTIDPADACRELARRYLHVFGPTTADGFARWAGISRRAAAAAFASLEGSLLPVRSPLGDELLLADDEPAMRAAADGAAATARLLPSGDAYFLLDGAERELLVPRADQRQRLWTSRVWPGALLVDGEIRGTWRRANHIVSDRRLGAPVARGARRDRGRGRRPAAPEPRPADRGGLEDA